MPIIVNCDLCGQTIATHTTLGVAEAGACIPTSEKRCEACTLQTRLAAWPQALQVVVQSFVSARMPEIRQHMEAMIRQKFVDYAIGAAKGHFGSLYDAALPSIQQEVLALRDTPMTITVTFGS